MRWSITCTEPKLNKGISAFLSYQSPYLKAQGFWVFLCFFLKSMLELLMHEPLIIVQICRHTLSHIHYPCQDLPCSHKIFSDMINWQTLLNVSQQVSYFFNLLLPLHMELEF